MRVVDHTLCMIHAAYHLFIGLFVLIVGSPAIRRTSHLV